MSQSQAPAGAAIETPPSAEKQIGMLDAAAASLAVSLGAGLDLVDATLLASAACDCVLAANTGE